MLRYILVIAAAVGLLAPVARADLELGDPIDIHGFFDGEFAWGIEGPHLFGGESLYTDVLFGTDIFVDSLELEPPKGKKFAGQINISYSTEYLFGFPHFETVDISGIKEPGGKNFINSVKVLGELANFSTVTTDGFNIHFEADSELIGIYGGSVVKIYWTQIPAPGALALLGLAGLLGTRRCRRQ